MGLCSAWRHPSHGAWPPECHHPHHRDDSLPSRQYSWLHRQQRHGHAQAPGESLGGFLWVCSPAEDIFCPIYLFLWKSLGLNMDAGCTCLGSSLLRILWSFGVGRHS